MKKRKRWKYVNFITNHARTRFAERVEKGAFDGETDILKISNAAYRYGKEPRKFVEPLTSFLLSLTYDNGKFSLKVYQGYVFVFDNTYGCRLITIYKLPSEFGDGTNYLHHKDKDKCFVILVDNEPIMSAGDIIFFNTEGSAKTFINNNTKIKDSGKKVEIVEI